jgi:hypothetical protein
MQEIQQIYMLLPFPAGTIAFSCLSLVLAKKCLQAGTIVFSSFSFSYKFYI